MLSQLRAPPRPSSSHSLTSRHIHPHPALCVQQLQASVWLQLSLSPFHFKGNHLVEAEHVL